MREPIGTKAEIELVTLGGADGQHHAERSPASMERPDQNLRPD
jgi:hypothetical protein